MSKTIYKEARWALKNLYDPLRITESGNLVDVPRPRLVVKKALDYAENQDKLLKLYRELEEMFILYISKPFPNEELKDASWDEIILKKKQIKELESNGK